MKLLLRHALPRTSSGDVTPAVGSSSSSPTCAREGWRRCCRIRLPPVRRCTSSSSCSGERAEGLRGGSTARLHNEDDDANKRMSVPLRQQLCAHRGCRGNYMACQAAPHPRMCLVATCPRPVKKPIKRPGWRLVEQAGACRCKGRARVRGLWRRETIGICFAMFFHTKLATQSRPDCLRKCRL